MKPSFALNLSHDGISLLHRAQAGWLSVGDVSLDAPDLVDELVVLRRTAADLEADGMTTKVVIPNSQILYVEVDAPGPTRADRLAQIREGLVGLTPYDERDLMFDWKIKKGKAQVAVVTRETLAEAETFATQYRFNPVSFVAIPSKGEFDGEPFFGPTRHASTLLAGGETVEPDKRRIEVLGKLGDAVPEPEPEPVAEEPEAAEGPAPADAPPMADAPAEPGVEAVAPDAERAGGPEDAGADGMPVDLDAEAAGPGEDAPGEDVPGEDGPDDDGPDAGAAPEEEESLPEVPLSFSSRRAMSSVRVNGHAVPPADPAQEPEPPAPSKGPMVADLPPVESRPAVRVTPPTEPEPEQAEAGDGPATPEDAADPDQRTAPAAPRRAGAPLPPPVRITPRPSDPDSPAARAATVDPDSPELSKKADPVLDQARATMQGDGDAPAEAGRGRRFALGRDKTAEGAEASKGRGRLADTLGRMSGRGKSAEKDRIEEMAAALKAPTTTFDRPAPPVNQPKPGKTRPVTATEADAMTVFGARGQTPPRERPRFVGAALTLVVLLALAAVALWSTWFMNDVASGWFGLGEETGVTEAEEPAPVIVPDGLAPVSETAPEIAGVPEGTAPETEPETDAAPAEEGPSEPLPGIEVTALQPEPEQASPAAPEAPVSEGETPDAPPAAAEETPPAVTGEGEAPELAAAEPAAPETPEIDTATAAPPEAPAEEPEVSSTALDDGPPPDIATVAPELPESSAPSEDVTAPTDGGEAPGELEIVRLDAPPAAETAPEPESAAPVPTQTAPPGPEEAAEIYERTGVSVLAPAPIDSPGIDRIDRTILSSADAALAPPAARGLPEADAMLPEAPAPLAASRPPMPLIEFDLDERGLVRATEEGTLSPRGVMIFRGEPSVVPPPRPGTEPPVDDTNLGETPAPETAEDETELAVETPAAPPPERPEDLVEEEEEAAAEESDAAPEGEDTTALDPETLRDLAPILSEEDLAEADERARFGGLTRDELADIRPSLRPGDPAPEATVELAAAEVPAPEADADEAEVTETEAVAPDAEVAEAEAEEAAPEPDPTDPLIDFANVVPPLRPGTEVPGRADNNPSLAGELLEAETAALDEAPEPEEEPSFPDATELAVADSLTPPTRPAGFASVVQAALEEAATAPSPPAQEAPANDPTPEVSVPVRAPDIPSSAAVAATATDENALRMNRVNLIGIYGSASNRRALVRLASGRYVKVQVGDSVDGGQVAAIGDDRLSYVKRGRTIVLTMPSG